MPYIFRSDLKDNIAINPKNQLTSSVQPHPVQTTGVSGPVSKIYGPNLYFTNLGQLSVKLPDSPIQTAPDTEFAVI